MAAAPRIQVENAVEIEVGRTCSSAKGLDVAWTVTRVEQVTTPEELQKTIGMGMERRHVRSLHNKGSPRQQIYSFRGVTVQSQTPR